MNEARLLALTVGHALAEGAPVGAALRSLHGGALPLRAAATADSGDLPGALQQVGLAPDLCRLALECPGALAPTLRRLGTFPSPLLFQAPFLQLLAYLTGIVLLHGAVLTVLRVKLFGLVGEEFGLAGADPPFGAWPVVGFLVLAIPSAVAILFGTTGFASGPGWGRHLAAARAWAIAAGILESDAPISVRARALERLGVEPTTVAAADMALQACLGQAFIARERFVAAARFGGLGGLTLLALLALSRVYAFLAAVPGLP